MNNNEFTPIQLIHANWILEELKNNRDFEFAGYADKKPTVKKGILMEATSWYEKSRTGNLKANAGIWKGKLAVLKRKPAPIETMHFERTLATGFELIKSSILSSPLDYIDEADYFLEQQKINNALDAITPEEVAKIYENQKMRF